MMLPIDIIAVFLPLVGAAIAGLLGRHIGDKASQLLTCGCVLVAACLSVPLFNEVALGGHGMHRVLFSWIESGDLSVFWGIKLDTLSVVMMLVVNIVSAMIHIYSIGYMEHEAGKSRFMAFMSLFTFFMVMLVTAPNLLQMFFGWEGVGLMSYLLIGFWYEKPSANDASMKAFIVNRIGDFGFLLGILGFFLLFGSLEYGEIFSRANSVAGKMWFVWGYPIHALTAVCLLLFVGAMGKSAQFGLHTWLPDAMEGPTPVSALIHAATMVTAGVFMVVRMSPVFEHTPFALAVVAVVGALTCIFAATIALTQFDIKKVIAYSTMSQLGYMFFAAGVSAYSAAIFHLATHAFFKALLFLGAGSVIHALAGEQDLRRMGGLWRVAPWTCAMMWIGSLALAGIGIEGVFGFAGFYSKDLILASALERGTGLGTTVYVVGLIGAFMTAFYSWRLLFLAFHGEPREEEAALEHAHESSWVMLAPLVPLALGAIFGGWYALDWFEGEGMEAFWKGALVAQPFWKGEGQEHVASLYLWLPAIVAVLGIGLAYFFYQVMPEMPAIVSTAFGGVYRVVCRKFYIDEIYDVVFVRSARWVGALLWKKGDDALIDGYGPDGIAKVSLRLAKKVGALETGYIYHYALAMVVGLAGFISWFWFKG